MDKGNLWQDLPDARAAEQFTALLQHQTVRIERIVSHGQASPEGFWYDQEEHEWVLLLQGAARLRLEGEAAITLRPGDHLNIPAHTRHRVEWTDPNSQSVWLAVFYRSCANESLVPERTMGGPSRPVFGRMGVARPATGAESSPSSSGLGPAPPGRFEA